MMSALQGLYLYEVLDTSIASVRLRPRLIVLELHHSLKRRTSLYELHASQSRFMDCPEWSIRLARGRPPICPTYFHSHLKLVI